MIFEILKYYAQFPDHNKVLEIFSKGRSELLEYGILQEEIKKMPDLSAIRRIISRMKCKWLLLSRRNPLKWT